MRYVGLGMRNFADSSTVLIVYAATNKAVQARSCVLMWKPKSCLVAAMGTVVVEVVVAALCTVEFC